MSECGVPAFEPNTTEGFDIDTIEYDEDDGISTNNNQSSQGGQGGQGG